jgi:exodeoxyribonuclease VII large subunit
LARLWSCRLALAVALPMVDLAGSLRASGAWSVAGLVGAVAALLEQGIPACTVRGEISGFSRAASGHCYFTLKDPDGAASLRCAMFRRAASLLSFVPADGQRVELRGRIAVYEPRGELQFITEAMQAAGAGALYERFLRLRARLEAEGLFDPALKRPLPSHPRAIGVVTSLAGAALHDVATTLARRSAHVRVIVYPSVVQGSDAPAALCAAIATAVRRDEVDVLIVCRGGGSLEDLWAFNDERVVRAIRAAPMHVVSGVGHETDVTLADLAADLRAPTPTAAAELVAPATAPLRAALDGLGQALERRVAASLDNHAQRLDRLTLRLARPSESVARRAHVLDLLAQRLGTAPLRALATGQARVGAAAAQARHALDIARMRGAHRLDAAEARLQSLDPQRVLARGYALLLGRDDKPITTISQLAVGTRISARLADGAAELATLAVIPRSDGG